MTPKEALNHIESLDKFGIDLGLDRIERCMGELGDPQNEYPTVHIAGTNGKGSTSMFVTSILHEAGYRTGFYSSPPLEFFGERIRVGMANLPDEEVPALLERVLEVVARVPECATMTQFEIITAMGFVAFADAGVDVGVIEVGLGGRLDSTNVITPACSVVTNVGMEHSEHLGDTLQLIAREKGGVLKPGRPAITCAEGEALEELVSLAKELGVPLKVLGRDFFIADNEDNSYAFRSGTLKLDSVKSGLFGGFQRYNLAAALATVETLVEDGWNIPEKAILAGALNARWPGRMELIGDSVYVLLDGAHNPAAAVELARVLRERFTEKKLTLVLGILGDKDAESILEHLLPLSGRVILTASASARAMEPGELEKIMGGFGMEGCEIAPTVAGAVETAINTASAGELVCITGSLTVVGEARAKLRSLGLIG